GWSRLTRAAITTSHLFYCVRRLLTLASSPTRRSSDLATMRSYEQGEFIHGPGEKSDQLFIVHRGKVKVYRLSETGREQLLRILEDRKSTRLNSSHVKISYASFCLKKKKIRPTRHQYAS